MKIKIIQTILITAVCTVFTGCAIMQPLPTPTGKPEVTINTTDTARIKGALVSVLAANGYTLAQDTPYSLVFSRQMQGGGAILYQAALGNSYSSTPQQNISFTFAPAGGATHVFGHMNTSMQNAFGQTQQTDMDYGRAAHQIQDLLLQVKAGAESRGHR